MFVSETAGMLRWSGNSLVDQIRRLNPVSDLSADYPFDHSADLGRLRALVRPQRGEMHVWRAQIVLFSAQGSGRTPSCGRDLQVQDLCLALAAGSASPPRRREDLLRDKTPSRTPKLDPSLAGRVMALTMEALNR